MAGLLTRKQAGLYEQFKRKAAQEGKTAAGAMEDLVKAYVDDRAPLPTTKINGQVQSNPAPVANSMSVQVGSLEYEMAKTKSIIASAFEISDMIRGPAQEQGPAPEDTMIQTLLTTYLKNQQGGAADLPRP